MLRHEQASSRGIRAGLAVVAAGGGPGEAGQASYEAGPPVTLSSYRDAVPATPWRVRQADTLKLLWINDTGFLAASCRRSATIQATTGKILSTMCCEMGPCRPPLQHGRDEGDSC